MSSQTIAGRDIHYTPAELHVNKLTWRPGAYGLVFNEAGHVLVVDNLMNGRKEFPGGGVEVHESFEEALVREVWEETGLNVSVDSFILMNDEFFLTPSGKHWHTIKCFYQCQLIDGDLRATILEDEEITNPHFIDPVLLNKDNLTIGWDALAQVMRKQ